MEKEYREIALLFMLRDVVSKHLPPSPSPPSSIRKTSPPTGGRVTPSTSPPTTLRLEESFNLENEKRLAHLEFSFPIPSAVVLCGSFFPPHAGHLALMNTARRYFPSASRYIFMASSIFALKKKFPSLPSGGAAADPRAEWLQALGCDVIVSSGPIGEEIRKLTGRIVQVFGGDSGVPRKLDPKNSLVVLNRPLTQENAEIYEAKGVAMATPTDVCPPSSSSCVRYLLSVGIDPLYDVPSRAARESMKDYCFPLASPTFDVSWLTDSGVTLGYGAHGIVRKMYLGRHPVAVKIITNNPEGYAKECAFLRRIMDTCPEIIPRVIGMCEADSVFGLIVMELCVSLPRSSLPHTNHKFQDASRIRDVEKFVSTHFERWCGTSVEKSRAVPEDIPGGMVRCLKSLHCHAHIFHRDIKIDAFLRNPTNGWIVMIDFGVSVWMGDDMRGHRRGTCIYYPPRCLAKHVYNAEDEFHCLSMVCYEVVVGHRIFPELGEDIDGIIKHRKAGGVPQWGRAPPIEWCARLWSNEGLHLPEEASPRSGRSFVIRYGSLPVKEKATHSFPVMVQGYRRAWGLRLPTWTALGVRHTGDPSDVLTALCVEVFDFDQWDAREGKGYHRNEVDASCVTLYPKGDQLPDSTYTFYIYLPPKIVPPSEQSPILLSYVDVIAAGALSISHDFATNFFKECDGWHHVADDRRAPRYLRDVPVPAVVCKFVAEQLVILGVAALKMATATTKSGGGKGLRKGGCRMPLGDDGNSDFDEAFDDDEEGK